MRKGHRIWKIVGMGTCLGLSLLHAQELFNDSGNGSNSAPVEIDVLPTDYVVPVFEDISVHDPSVIKVDDEYYLFGSHLSAAKSKDLMKWQRVADIVNHENPLFDNVFEALAETFEWAQSNTLWAADVTQLKDGRFYFYYNACKGDSPRSAVGLAVSDHVEGPYENRGIFLKSGMWGLPSEDGTVYDASKHPNAVDPHVFYDNEGRLWMIYGSYSGGIFILEMDDPTGLPLEGQGYGKHLMGNNHQRIEGAYVIYSPHTQYYYLFVSFGGLGRMDGYNVRVFRSVNPDGPYLDSEGQDMEMVRTNILFDDDAIEPFGVKLIGNHYFSGTVPQVGYMSPGHNSAFYDENTGQYFLIFHTRFLMSGEYHSVRVHEMQFNEDAWPVVSPLRYAPRITYGELEEASEVVDDEEMVDDPAQGNEIPEVDPFADPEEEPVEIPPPSYADDIELAEIPGSYQLIRYEKEISPTIVYSERIVLQDDGSISGAQVGTWEISKAKNSILIDLGERKEIEVEADADEEPSRDPSIGYYNGVVSRQWNEATSAFVIVFSALSDDGRAIWGVRN